MTILQINVLNNSGSTGRITEQIGIYAMDHGYKSYIAYGRYSNNSVNHIFKIGNKIDFYSHVLLTRITDKHGLGSRKATIKLISKIKKINPDIIHFHNIHGYYLNYPLLFEYLNSTNIPIVMTLHDCWTFTGHCVHFEAIGCYKWKTHCENCPQHSLYPSSWVADNSMNNFDLKKKYFCENKNIHIVTPSYWLANLLSESFLKNIDRRIIYNGIDINIFKPIETKKKYCKFLILGISNIWDKSKGFDDFIQLSSLLDFEVYKLVLVGRMSEKQIKELPKEITHKSKTESLDELVSYYSSADVTLNLTYADTFPTTNLESLACGTPIITYKTGGSPEAISKDTGFVVKQGDLSQVIKCIGEIRNKGKNEYKKACRQRAITMFNKDINFAEYIKLYNSLIQS